MIRVPGVERDVILSESELARYSRHLVMPEVGLEGQKKLKASSVLILSAPGASARRFEAGALQEFFAARGVKSDIELLKDTGDAAPALIRAAKTAGADILIAGAFGHPRLQEFIFGGATRGFLHADGPSLFLSH